MMSNTVDRETKFAKPLVGEPERRGGLAPWFKRATVNAASALAMLLSPALAAASPSFTLQAELLVPEDPLDAPAIAAISGDTAIVTGTNFETRAYVYVRSGSTWTPTFTISRPVGEERAGFAKSIAIDGDTILVGSSVTGHVLVFKRNGTAWTWYATLAASDAQDGDLFGNAVSIKGNTAIVGAMQHDGGTGAVYVFTRTDSTWTEVAKLTASDAVAGQQFGSSVSLNGTTLAVGTKTNHIDSAAYIFNGADGTWVEQDIVVTPGNSRPTPSANVALDGDVLLTGAGDGADVFVRDGGVFGAHQQLLSTEPAEAVFNVAVSGNLVVSRAPIGSVHVFERDSSGIHSLQVLTQSTLGESYALAVDGNTILATRGDYATTKGALVFTRGYAPTAVALSANTIPENKSAGTLIGTLSTIDADSGDTFTYTLVPGTGSTDNASFTLSGNQLKSAVKFNYENKSSYSIRVRTTDYFGYSFEQVLTIKVTNVAETNRAPVCSSATATPNSLVMSSDLAFASIAIGNISDADNDNMTVKITSIRQDEATRANSSDPYPDGKGVGTSIPYVRKQAVSTGNGRVYTIAFEVTDVNKATTCGCVVRVGVKPKSTSATPVNNGTTYDSTR